ncbi:MAG: hypothetical protein JW936_05365 [Sedimentisphaerales bacterium]|nr:hypothetical protein [Sedimentisphaerales bacterium]
MRAFRCQCGKTFTWTPEKAGKHATCPGCKTQITIPQIQDTFEPNRQSDAEPQTLHCPSCKNPLQPNAVVCIECGYNLKTGKQLTTKIKVSAPADPDPDQTDKKQQSPDDSYSHSPDRPTYFEDEHPFIAGKLRDLSKTGPILCFFGSLICFFDFSYLVGSAIVFICTPMIIIATYAYTLFAKAKGATSDYITFPLVSATGTLIFFLAVIFFGLRPQETLFTIGTLYITILFGPFITGFILLTIYALYPKIAADYVEDRTRPRKFLFIALAFFVLGAICISFAIPIGQALNPDRRTPTMKMLADIRALRECNIEAERQSVPHSEYSNGQIYDLTPTYVCIKRSYQGGPFDQFQETYGPPDRTENQTSSSDDIQQIHWYQDFGICTNAANEIIFVMCQRGTPPDDSPRPQQPPSK